MLSRLYQQLAIVSTALLLQGCLHETGKLSPEQISITDTGVHLAQPAKQDATLYLIPLYSRVCLVNCSAYTGSYLFLRDAQGRYFYLNNDNSDWCYYIKPENYQIYAQNTSSFGKSTRSISLAPGQSSYYTLMHIAESTHSGPKINAVDAETANFYVGQHLQCSQSTMPQFMQRQRVQCRPFNPDQGYVYHAHNWTIYNPTNAHDLSAFNYQRCTVNYADGTSQQCRYGFMSMTLPYTYAPLNRHCPSQVGSLSLNSSDKQKQVVSATCYFSPD